MVRCQSCSSSNLIESGAAIICGDCGVVAEESQIVSDVTFAENSAGGAVVQGSYVGNEQRGARTTGPGGFRSGGAGVSREQTVANAKHAMRALGFAKKVPTNTIEKAGRLFLLALEGGTYRQDGNEPKNFVLGRRSEYTQASCLYVACRMDKTNHMLIDFADAINVNVFILGRSYLRLVRCLCVPIPVIDPAIYIQRFASMLDFGDETTKVALDATRLVQRFKKDWISHGRRPAGVCGASLLLAARMNNFRRSIAEIVQVVKIGDITLRKRLEEFQRTPSSRLTIDDFRNIWLEEESEPPAYYLARMPKKKKARKGKQSWMLKKSDIGEFDSDADSEDQEEGSNNGDEAQREEEQNVIDPRLHALADEATEAEINQYLDDPAANDPTAKIEPMSQDGQNGVLKRSQTAQPDGDDELAGLDEEELDAFILAPEEVRIKTRVWMEFNRDYLEKELEKQLKMEADIKAGITPKPAARRKPKQVRDSSTAPATAVESTKELLRSKRNFSKKLNYSVIDSIFDDESNGDRRSKRKKRDSRASDAESGTDGDDRARRRGNRAATSDAETTDADADGARPLSRRQRKSREYAARQARRGTTASSAAGEAESGTDRATSHGMTDADTDGEGANAGENWKQGLGQLYTHAATRDED